MLGDLHSYMQKKKKRKEKKKKLDHQLTPYTKISSRWIKDLNIICHGTIKVLEEKIGRKISDIPHSNIFTDMSPKARDIKERTNKWDIIKNKKLLHGKRKYQNNKCVKLTL